LVLLSALLLLCSCGAKRPMKVPGETDIEISSVTLRSRGGSKLTVDYGPLLDRLGMRKSSLVLPGRYYSEPREAEDRRRIIAYWKNFGFFDVKVDTPLLEHDKEENEVAITWTIEQGKRYRISQVRLLHPPADQWDALGKMIPLSAGETDVDLEKFRHVRRKMADYLRRKGFGHARVFSRAFVDRKEKLIHWFYYVDAGPRTKVGLLVVDGAVKTDPKQIIERSGIRVGAPFDWNQRYDAEFHLLDTGAYAASFIRAQVDTKFHVPGDAPDTGGKLRDDQIDDRGNLVARELPARIDVKIHVVEAPSQQLRVRASAEIDPTRFDTALSSRLWLRNLFGSWHHLVLEGRIGYGWLLGDDDNPGPSGLYGEALVRYLKPMLGSRLLDFRTTARFRDELYTGFHLRELTAGPGLRVALAPGRAENFHGGGLMFDVDLLARWAQQVGFGPFDATVRDDHALAKEDSYVGAELQTSIIWDERDNQLEALRGHLLAFRAALSPGVAERFNRYLTLAPEARGFLPLSSSFSVGLRAAASWVLLDDDDGVPLGPRLFGGGAWTMRGFGRNELSPMARACARDAAGAMTECHEQHVGAMSLAESSLELRFLPRLKPYGAVVFSDLGGAGVGANPFEEGVSFAAGLGLRLRFWYLPAAFDFSYRVLKNNEVQVPDDDPFLVFFRLGEAF